jgi:hypothetical protein
MPSDDFGRRLARLSSALVPDERLRELKKPIREKLIACLIKHPEPQRSELFRLMWPASWPQVKEILDDLR